MNNSAQNQSYKEGEIKIEYTPGQNKKSSCIAEEGDYVNYEEIK